MRCAAGRVCFSNAARLVPVRVCREDFACTTVLRWIGRGTEVGTIVLRHRRWPSGWMLFACDTPSPTRPRPRPGYEHGDRICYARHAHPPGEAQTARYKAERIEQAIFFHTRLRKRPARRRFLPLPRVFAGAVDSNTLEAVQQRLGELRDGVQQILSVRHLRSTWFKFELLLKCPQSKGYTYLYITSLPSSGEIRNL